VPGVSSKERSTAIGLLAALVVAGCARPSTPAAVPPAEADECVLIPQPSERVDTLRIALQQEVRPPDHPGASTVGERVVYHHLYEALIRADCEGGLFPALAEEWNSEDGGRRWRFRLAADARLWDGSIVSADRVVASWTSLNARHRGIEPNTVYIPDSRELVVPLKRRHQTIPLVFASLDLAVIGDFEVDGWPAGTGPYRMAALDSNTRMLLTEAQTGGDSRRPPIRLELVSGQDLRDVIDEGYDLLVTDDVRVLDYARAQPQYLVVPLQWDRTHVVLSPRRVRSPGVEPGDAQRHLPRPMLEEMARDVVRSEARASEPPYWWSELGSCDAADFGQLESRASRRGEPGGTQRIVYRTDDPVARDLAERLVALGASSDDVEILASLGIGSELAAGISQGESRLLATGLDPATYDRAIGSGDDLVYILALPRKVTAPCQAAAELLEGVPWLLPNSDAVQSDLRLLTGSIEALVDTRKQAVARRGRVGLWIGWDGTPLLYRP
jgi:hypothetical protein